MSSEKHHKNTNLSIFNDNTQGPPTVFLISTPQEGWVIIIIKNVSSANSRMADRCTVMSVAVSDF